MRGRFSFREAPPTRVLFIPIPSWCPSVSNPSAIFQLPAKRIASLLIELQALIDRPGVSLPELTLLLVSGNQVRGALIEFLVEGPLPADRWLLLRNVSGPLDVTYVPLAAIEGLTLHLTDDNIHLLSFGKLKPQAAKVPSRLELERLTRTISTEFSLSIAILWDELPSSDRAFQNLGELLQDLKLILMELLEDELGDAAVRDRIRQVAIRSGRSAAVSLEGGTLTLQGWGDPVFAFLDRRSLAMAIEGLL
jgi:hypothetical protein